MIARGTLTPDASGAASASLTPSGPWGWTVTSVTLSGSGAGKVEVLVDDTLVGVSYYPSSDVGSGTIQMGPTSTLTLSLSGGTAQNPISYTVNYQLAKGST